MVYSPAITPGSKVVRGSVGGLNSVDVVVFVGTFAEEENILCFTTSMQHLIQCNRQLLPCLLSNIGLQKRYWLIEFTLTS